MELTKYKSYDVISLYSMSHTLDIITLIYAISLEPMYITAAPCRNLTKHKFILILEAGLRSERPHSCQYVCSWNNWDAVCQTTCYVLSKNSNAVTTKRKTRSSHIHLV